MNSSDEARAATAFAEGVAQFAMRLASVASDKNVDVHGRSCRSALAMALGRVSTSTQSRSYAFGDKWTGTR